MLSFFLAREADIKRVAGNYRSVLHEAASRGSVNVVKLLLDRRYNIGEGSLV